MFEIINFQKNKDAANSRLMATADVIINDDILVRDVRLIKKINSNDCILSLPQKKTGNTYFKFVQILDSNKEKILLNTFLYFYDRH